MIGPSENHFFLGYMQYQQNNNGKDDDAAAQLWMTQQLLMDRVVFSMERDMVKKGIHLIVTAIASMCFPLVVFVYSYYFMEQPKRSSRTMRRNERIKRALEKCRKPWNNNSEQQLVSKPENNTNTTDVTEGGSVGHDGLDDDENDENHKECPICLTAFEPNETVVVSKYCHCGSRVCFHEDCILEWLCQGITNPRRLCPCCRQPFFPPKVRRRKNSGTECMK